MSDQYERRSILRYERVFGDGFVSSGGATVTKELFGDLAFASPPRILDIGGGLGGAAFLFEEHFDATVVAVDLSPLMVELARERADDRDAKSDFRVANIMEVDFEPESFDLVWTRDTLLHIGDKAALFRRVLPWLVPGGRLLLTDYARGPRELSAGFERYVAESGYDLRDLDDYCSVVRAAGFRDVVAQDWTPRFLDALQREVEDLRGERAAFLADFGEEDFDYLLERWKRKIAWCEGGDMKTIRLAATR